LFKQVDYVMVTVSDMSRSIKFHRDVLGIPVRFESPDWTEFETGNTTLALHGGGKTAGGKGSRELTAGSCSIGFYVPNLDQSYNELKARGVTFVVPPTEREGEAIKLAVCLDPDGLEVSIAEQRK